MSNFQQRQRLMLGVAVVFAACRSLLIAAKHLECEVANGCPDETSLLAVRREAHPSMSADSSVDLGRGWSVALKKGPQGASLRIQRENVVVFHSGALQDSVSVDVGLLPYGGEAMAPPKEASPISEGSNPAQSVIGHVQDFWNRSDIGAFYGFNRHIQEGFEWKNNTKVTFSLATSSLSMNTANSSVVIIGGKLCGFIPSGLPTEVLDCLQTSPAVEREPSTGKLCLDFRLQMQVVNAMARSADKHFQASFIVPSLQCKSDAVFSRTTIIQDMLRRELVVGFGAQPSRTSYNHDGEEVPILSLENGLGRGDDPVSAANNFLQPDSAGDKTTTYSASAIFSSSAGYFEALIETNYAVFSFQNSSGGTKMRLDVYHSAAAGLSSTVVPTNPLGATLRFGVPDACAAVEFSSNCTWQDVSEVVASHTGTIPQYAEWPLDGFILGAQGGETKVQRQVDEAAAAGVPLAGVWIQDWSGVQLGRPLWDWQPGKCTYPLWWDMIGNFSKQGIKTLTYLNTFIVDHSGESPEPLPENCSEASGRTWMYKEIRDLDLAVSDTAGGPLLRQFGGRIFSSLVVDLSNDDAYIFYKAVIRCMLLGIPKYCDEELTLPTKGETITLRNLYGDTAPPKNNTHFVYGFMADFADHLPLRDISVFTKQDPMAVHNDEGNRWTALIYDAVSNIDVDGFDTGSSVPFHRTGSTTSVQHSIASWAGDQMTNWERNDGLGSILRTYLSAGSSGWSNMHSDVGGIIPSFMSLAGNSLNADLFVRWFEMNVFTASIVRSHPIGAQALTGPWTKTKVNKLTVMQHVTRLSKLHRGLKEYKLKLLQEAQSHGYPLARHTLYECSLNYNFSRYEELSGEQIMLGNDVLFAPVVNPFGSEVRNVLVPPCSGDGAQWTFIWESGGKRSFSPGEVVTLSAPVGWPAVLVRVGSLAESLLAAAVASL